MSEQIDILKDLKLVEKSDDEKKPDYKIKCYFSELKKIEDKSFEELFSGFDSIKCITFSYNLDAISKIMKFFKYGEIVIGAEYLYQKDNKMNALVEICSDVYEMKNNLFKYSNLINMMSNKDLNIKVSTIIIDHRKIYLLRTDDKKRTRVIVTSANLSNRAWNGDQIEVVDCFEKIEDYDKYESEFETAWDNSIEIPSETMSAKFKDDLIDGNPILSAAKKKINNLTLVQKNDIPENFRYTYESAAKGLYQKLLKSEKVKSNADVIQLTPENIKRIDQRRALLNREDSNKKGILGSYPKMHIDYDRKQVTINDKLVDLNPTEAEIKSDINTLLNIFDNYSDFLHDTDKMKETHFKLLNALFCSPFIAKLRCSKNYAINDFDNNSSLPLFLIVSSTQSNCGKTFMISAIIKMMTGISTNGVNKKEMKKDIVEKAQKEIKSVPFFIDELDNTFLGNIKDIIKNSENCENTDNTEQPMIVFASNDVTAPVEYIRKRCIFLKLDGGLPLNIDRSAYEGKGKALLRKLGTGLYREYQRIMIDRVNDEYDLRTLSHDLSNEYYTDIMATSSETLIEIFKEYGYEIPKYMRRLSWNDDYSSNAKHIYDESLDIIIEEHKLNPNLFNITNNYVSIEYGNNKDDTRKCESLKNTLPNEISPRLTSSRDGCKLTFNRKEFERIANYKFKKTKFFKKRR